MKKLSVLLLVITALVFFSCSRTLRLNRAEGVRGPNAPEIRTDGVLFRIHAPEASLVTLVGNFNGWSAQATPLKKDDQGNWSAVLPLNQVKKIQYKFVVDGYWIADPDNPDTENNGSGSVNSVLVIK